MGMIATFQYVRRSLIHDKNLAYITIPYVPSRLGRLLDKGVPIEVDGQAIGQDTEGTLIGAAVGTGIGYIIGKRANYLDRRFSSRAQTPQVTGGDANSDCEGTM